MSSMNVVSESNGMKCEVCPNSGHLTCTSCHEANYCSREHQKADWKSHKKACSFLKLCEDQDLGRHYAATRDIKAGTAILNENPPLFSPSEKSDGDFTPVCLGCCAEMQESKKSNRCKRCKWPVCGKSCSLIASHAENECPIFEKNHVKYSSPPPSSAKLSPYYIYEGINVLRGIIVKKKNPSLWERMMSLQYERNNDYNTNKEPFFQIWHDMFKKIREFFGITNDPELGNHDNWVRVYSILVVNAFASHHLEYDEKNDHQSKVVLLAPKASMFAHACAPNCYWNIGFAPTFQLRIRASVDIKKGEILTIAYSQTNLHYGTLKRQDVAMITNSFICKCVRCMDPTEFETYSSSVKCSSCNSANEEGYFISTSPLDLSAPIKCSHCNREEKREKVNEVTKAVEEELQAATFMSLLQLHQGAPDSNWAPYENFIENNKNTLHKNHWIFQEAKRMILRSNTMMRDQMETLVNNMKKTEKYIGILREFLEIHTAISPGIAFNRGILLRNLSAALLVQLEYEMPSDKDFNIFLKQPGVLNRLQEIKKFHDEVFNYFNGDVTSILPNGQFSYAFKQFQENRKMLQFYITVAEE